MVWNILVAKHSNGAEWIFTTIDILFEINMPTLTTTCQFNKLECDVDVKRVQTIATRGKTTRKLTEVCIEIKIKW